MSAMISGSAEPAAADVADNASPYAPAAGLTPLYIRALELALVFLAVYGSSAPYIFNFLRMGYSFSAAWDPIQVWLYFVLQNVASLGTLIYILIFASLRAPRPGFGTSTRLALEQTPALRSGLELGLVIWTAFGMGIIESIGLVLGGITAGDLPAGSGSADFFSILHRANALGVLAYVLYRNSLKFSDLGLRWASQDAAMALPLLIGAELMYSVGSPIIFWASQAVAGQQLIRPDLGPFFYGERISMLQVPDRLLNGFHEELIVRAFLMTAVSRLTNNNVLAICASVAIQVSYHFYQGAPLALTHIGGFLVFAVYYSRTRRILPVILAHSSFDLMSVLSYAARLNATS